MSGAQMMMQGRQPAGGGGASLTHSHVTAASQSGNAVTYTFAGTSLGTASADRRIVVVALARGTGGASSPTVTIDGVSATIDLFHGYAGTGNGIIIASAAVPTGTSGSVVVGWTSTQLRCAIGVYAITGGALTVTDTESQNFAALSTGFTLTPTTVGGVAIGGFLDADAVTGSSWAGMTLDASGQVGAEASSFSVASAAISGTTLPVTVNNDDATANTVAVVAYEGA